jgi:AcrR family transcriptional regulator
VPRPTADERKSTILDAVLRMIIDVGYTKMTIADVARVAGVSTALVHYHFSSKNELIAAALRAASNDDKRLRESIAAADATATTRLERVLTGSLPRDHPDASWLLWIETWGETRREPAIRDVMDDLNRHEQTLLVELIEEGNAEREFACGEPTTAAERLMALRDGLAIQHTLFGVTHPAERYRDLLRESLRESLGLSAERFRQLVRLPVPAAG